MQVRGRGAGMFFGPAAGHAGREFLDGLLVLSGDGESGLSQVVADGRRHLKGALVDAGRDERPVEGTLHLSSVQALFDGHKRDGHLAVPHLADAPINPFAQRVERAFDDGQREYLKIDFDSGIRHDFFPTLEVSVWQSFASNRQVRRDTD